MPLNSSIYCLESSVLLEYVGATWPLLGLFFSETIPVVVVAAGIQMQMMSVFDGDK